MISSAISVEHSRRLIGSRGSRRSAGVRAVRAPVPSVPERPEPAPVREVAPTPSARLGDGWLGRLLSLRHRRHAAAPERSPDAPAQAPCPTVSPPAAGAGDRRRGASSLERGLRAIRRTDRGFDPTRFKGYAGMVFRAAQNAWMAQDMVPLRDRITQELHDALQAQCDRLRSSRRVNRIDEIEITTTVTEAWQENGRDYVTAHVSGSLVDYTIDEARDVLVDGSRTVPRAVHEFWTFTRPAGLNFWMLCAIQA